MAGGISMLETPPWIISLTFLTFIAVTVLFEKIIHHTIHLLQTRQQAQKYEILHPDEFHGKVGHKKKHKKNIAFESSGGLLAAVQSLVSELTALGFASLLLISFQNDIVTICVSPNRYLKGKRWLDFEHGAPCCLSRTKDVTPCYLAYRNTSQYQLDNVCKKDTAGLPDMHSENTDGFYKVNATGYVTDFTAKERNLDPKAKYTMPESEALQEELNYKCYREVQLGWDECGGDHDQVPAVSLKTLHEIHIYIFFIAACHIAINVFLIGAAYIQLAVWKHWLSNPSRAQVLLQVQKVIDAHGEDVAAYRATLGGGPLADPVPSEEAPSASLTQNPGLQTINEMLESPFDDTKRPQLPQTIAINRPYQWRGRREDGKWTFGQVCKRVVRQLFPMAVSKNELEVVQASFHMTHEIHSYFQFTFINYLQLSLEDDFAQMVGLGWGSWFFIMCYILLTSAIGLLLWPIMVIAAIIAICLSIKFINIVWKETSGGNVHRSKEGYFYLQRPWVYCSFIQFMSFCLAYVFANELLFATQYSPDSCFFHTGFSKYGNLTVSMPVPWWVLFLFNVWMLIVLAGVIAPLYSIVVHSGYDYKPQFFSQAMQKHLQQVHRHREAVAVGFSKGPIVDYFKKVVKPKARASMHTLATASSAAKSTAMGALNSASKITQKKSFRAMASSPT